MALIEGVINIHANTHKLISKKLYNHVKETYNIELNKEKLVWGSIAPDILPKYKLYRHYYDNSIDYIILRIAKIIFINRFLDLNNGDSFTLKIFSRELGVISHYLSDFTCKAHADKWELPKSLVKHIKYEVELNDFSKSYEFKNLHFKNLALESGANNIFEELPRIKLFIERVVYEYLESEDNFGNDLDFALSLNTVVFDYIIESILDYTKVQNFAFDH